MTNFTATEPYNDLPILPPTNDVETKDILKSCIAARAALAELKQTAKMLPNQSVLVNTLPMLEAQASSEIENIVTTTDRLFQEFDRETERTDPATKEALRYRTALFEGYLNIRDRPLTTRTAETICSTIKNVQMEVRRVPGTTLQNDRTGEIIYTPPVGEQLLRDKLTNWEVFLHGNEDLDPLVKMAIAHYQFEAIHPFTDGNGRTGRVLNILYLIEQGLLDIPILYLSRYVIQHKDDYYRLLLEVTSKENWNEWLHFILEAVKETSRWTNDKIQAMLALLRDTKKYVRKANPKIYSAELVDVLFNQPYCRITNLEKAGIAKRQTASIYHTQLCESGILVEKKIGREKLFINRRYLRLLVTEANDWEPFVE